MEPPRKTPKLEASTGSQRKTPKIESTSEPETKPKISAQSPIISAKSASIVGDLDDISSLIASDIVTFYIGPKKKPYHIHRDLICSSSPILHKHFNTPLDPPTTKPNEMYLPTLNPSVFELLSSFLYRGSFPETPPPTQKEATTLQFTSIDDLNAAKIDQLLALHFLARDWALLDLQNLSLDHIRRYVMSSKQLFRVPQVKSVYEKCHGREDGLRRFVVDQFVFAVMRKTVPAGVRQACVRARMGIGIQGLEGGGGEGFLMEVLEAVVGMKRYPCPVDPGAVGRCVYHVHPKGVRCPE